MADTFLDVEITGDSRDVENKLRMMEHAFDDDVLARDFLPDYAAPVVNARTEARFDQEGDDVTGPWQPLSPATVAIRQAKGFGGSGPINVRTGEMKKYLIDSPPRIQTHSLGATMWMPGAAPTGQMAKKVSTAQYGSGNTPPRPVLGVNENDLELMLRAMGHYLAKHMGGSFFQ